MKIWNSIFLNRVFFIVMASIAVLFTFSYFYPVLFKIAIAALLFFAIVAVVDFILLFYKNAIAGERIVNSKFSNFDENKVQITIQNSYPYKVFLQIYEELPFQFSKREFVLNTKISGNSSRSIDYQLKPTDRGEYDFGYINVFAKSPLQIFIKKYVIGEPVAVAVYPSYLQLNKFDIKNFKYTTREFGIKRTRAIGHSSEFEQIKEYIKGDDFRHINWKASAKKDSLMVNQYVDEKSQQIYNVIDTGRSMQMPFEGLSLLDYAVNSSLIFSNVVIKNQDKAGIIYFNKRVEKILPADRVKNQMQKILNTLYKLKTDFKESDFGNLYAEIKQKINHRSLLVLYTNFEDINSMNRQMSYLKAIAKNHVLVVVFFVNTEAEKLIIEQTETTEDYYLKSVAEKFAYQKRLIVKELENKGIQVILTEPKNLTLNTINKYIVIKAKAMI